MIKDIYNLLAGKGRNGDTELAHITKEESHILKMLGGAGTINPWTGMPEYHKSSWVHNAAHEVGNPHAGWVEDVQQAAGGAIDYLNPTPISIYEQFGGETGIATPGELIQGDPLIDPSVNAATDIPKTPQEILIEKRRADLQASGATLLESGQTIGEMGLGQTSYTAKEYQGMNPKEIVDDIFNKQYGGLVPPDMAVAGVTVEEFKAQIAGTLQNMPQFKGADPEALGFKKEAKDIAVRGAESSWDATKYGLQGQAEKIGRNLQSGSGVGFRGSVGAKRALKKGFGTGLETRDIGLDTADLTYRSGVYGLEKEAESSWETDFSSYLKTLPPAVG